MKKLRFVAVLFGLFLGCATLLSAQTSTSKTKAPTTPPPELSKLNVATMLQQMNTAAATGDPDAPSPLQVVVEFLQLTPDQQTAFGGLLQARETAVVPLLQGIAQREQQVQALLAAGGDPAKIGVLIVQINGLQTQIVQTQQIFLSNFISLLSQDQQQILAAVAMAAQLQPVLPAFAQLQLF